MGYFLLLYIVVTSIIGLYDPYLGMWGLIGSVVIGALLGAAAFCESWTEFFIGIPVGLFLCACATI